MLPVPRFFRYFLERAGHRTAPSRVRDKYVDRPELLLDPLAHGFDVVEASDIAGDFQRFPAVLLDLGSNRRQGRAVSAVHHDSCTLTREQFDNRSADPARATRDQRDLAFKSVS